MVKNNKTNIFKEAISLFGSIYNFHKFEEKVSKSAMMLYSFILLITTTIITYFISSEAINNNSYLDIVEILVILPVFLLLIYGLFYVFLRAFDKEKKDFWEGFLVFLSIVFPFLLISSILAFIQKLIPKDNVLVVFIGFLVVILFVYYIFNIVLNLKNYYNTTSFRITSSLILVCILVFVFVILSFVVVIMQKLSQF